MNLRIDDMQEAFSNISTSEDPHAEYPYKLRLELFNLTVIDVGFYTCYFNTSENYDYTMQELVAKGQAKRTYVYVDGKAFLNYSPVKCYVNIFYFKRSFILVTKFLN